MFRTAIAAVALLLVAAEAKAQIRCQTYYQPTYQSSGYNYYTAPVQKVVAQEVVVAPLVVTVPVVSYAVPIQAYGATHYYSVHDAYQQRAAIRDVIREELRNYLATQGQPVAPGATYTPPPAVAPAPMIQPPVTQSGVRTDLGIDDKGDPQVIAAFVGTCYKCHGGSMGTKGNLRLLYEQNGNYALAKHGKERKWMIYGQASTGVMPPEAVNDGSKALKQEYLPALLKWTVSP